MAVIETTQNMLGHEFRVSRSDSGLMIRCVETGAEYDEAWDVPDASYTYEETDKPIPDTDSDMEEEYALAGRIVLGDDPSWAL